MKRRLILLFLVPACLSMAQPAPSSGGYAAPAQPDEPVPAAGGGPVSVTIRSACPNQVRVFYGDKPKFGSGTYSTIDSNSVNSHTFQPGEMLWVVDGTDNGLGGIAVTADTRELEIAASCDGVNRR
jgi:hypothetical protein